MAPLSNNDYSRLSSLKALRAEKEKLRWQIASQEEMLMRDWRGVREAFSVANAIRTIFSKIENIQALVTGVRDSYRSISAMFKNKEKEKEE
jgi:hypothetical protein